MKNALTVFFFLAIICLLPAQTTWFVQQAATGTNTGTSWNNAFTDLQTALATASNGDMIWVAKGTYTPTSSTDKTISFYMKNGLKMYGGFLGTETILSERNWTQNATILSGNIGALDTRLDNSLNVVTAYNVNNNSVLDGFTISDGYNPNDIGGGMVIADTLGTTPTEPVIENCTFTKNYAFSGGGMYILGNASTTAYTKPLIKNCLFKSNSAYHLGGAIYQSAPSIPNDTFLLKYCTFFDNRAIYGKGGAIYFNDMLNSTVKIYSCAFERDSAGEGGALNYPQNINATLILDSCLFKYNYAKNNGSALYHDAPYWSEGDGLNLFVQQSIFEDNTAVSLYILITREALLRLKIDNSIFSRNEGGGIFLYADRNSDMDITISNAIFMQNTSALYCCIESGSQFNRCSTTIENCVFAKNGYGVGFYQSKENNYINTVIRNSTFFQNEYTCFYKVTYPKYAFYTDTTFNNRMLIENCIAWQPNMDVGTLFFNIDPTQFINYPNGTGFEVKNSLLSCAAVDTLALGAGQFYEGNMFATYPEFMDTLTDNYRLKPCSPLINKGNNASVLANGILYDLDGLPRIQQDNVDMGAYEQSILCTSSTDNYAKKDLLLVISPNPSENGELCIRINDTDLTYGQLTIFNTFGSVIYRQKNTLSEGNRCLPLQQLPGGIYFVSFETKDTVYQGKWFNFRG
jgi:predicted outer membrane repeat protein